MSTKLELSNLLVPTDFSPAARAAFDQAMNLVAQDDPAVIVLHVIDPMLLDFAVRHGLAEHDDLRRELRDHAERELESYKSSAGNVQVKTVVSEGVPFLEIIRKADDFAVDAIVMGKIGWRGKLEKLLFGSTAEKVLRASRRPVIVLPSESVE